MQTVIVKREKFHQFLNGIASIKLQLLVNNIVNIKMLIINNIANTCVFIYDIVNTCINQK